MSTTASNESARPRIGKSWIGPSDVAKALAALGEVAVDPERTDKVGEFIGTLTGPSADELFGRIWDDPVGRAILLEGRDLRATLVDRERLAAMPEGSLGRAYFDWTAPREFTADGIAAAIEAQVPRSLSDPGATMATRVVDMHDLWHVLNGWDSDIMGEIHLLGYSYAQLGAWAWLALGVLANLPLVLSGRFDGIGCLRESVRRGRTASLLPAADWEAMLPLPIEEVRRRLGIEAPVPYERLRFDELRDLGSHNPLVRLLSSALGRLRSA
ncbi:MAG: Coq4 family protein [Alphaproteobacteria bacterium]